MAILHRTRTLPALIPRYVTRFSCIGPDCEDTCCIGWDIPLDKKTYKEYRSATDPVLSQFFKENVSKQEVNANERNFGRIELDKESQACPMMVERLCSIQQKLNETYLSDICFAYPRVSRDFGGQQEQSLQLSCPEAARQALLAPDAFDFIEGTITVRMDMVRPVTDRHGISLGLMNDLRIFCLNMFRTPGLALWERLAVLGIFCESLTTALAERKPETIPGLMDDYAALMEKGLVHGALAGIQPDHAAQALVFSTLWGSKDFTSTSRARNKIVDMVALGLGADPRTGQVSGTDLVRNYTRGVGRLEEALRGAPHLLEHYLVNEMFSNMFPFDAPSPYDSHLQLVARFGVLRLMLAAVCNTDGPLPDAALLVQTVQIHCRRFQHDSGLAQQVNRTLKDSEWGALQKLFSFLRT